MEDLIRGRAWPENGPRGARHSRRRKKLAGARGDGPSGHHLTREVDGEKEERETSSPRRQPRTEMAR
jgi:hypothetical protein